MGITKGRRLKNFNFNFNFNFKVKVKTVGVGPHRPETR
jgi:hypothetical protein